MIETEHSALQTVQRHVPVAVDTEVVGVVSIGDLVKFKSKLQRFELNYLNDYITAR